MKEKEVRTRKAIINNKKMEKKEKKKRKKEKNKNEEEKQRKLRKKGKRKKNRQIEIGRQIMNKMEMALPEPNDSQTIHANACGRRGGGLQGSVMCLGLFLDDCRVLTQGVLGGGQTCNN